MTLTVSTEPMDSRQLAMTIEVAEERIDQEMRKAARKIAQQVRIPGFRKGRVPFHILLQFVGREAIVNEFVDELGQEVYKEALEKEGLEPYYIGSLDNVDTEQAVRFHLTIPLPPEVSLGDYRDLRVEEEEVEADEEQIQERVQAILEQNADYVEADRPSQYGDLMTIDLKGVALDDEGNETETVVFDEEDWDVTPDQENPMEPAGLDEELVGLTPGEEKSFEISWPEDSPSMYAGSTVRFSVRVHKTQAFQTPAELTDEIAQNFGPDFENATDLLDNLRENALQEATQQAEAEHAQKVLQELIDMSDLAYPPVAVDLEIDRLVRNFDMRIRQMGMQGLEQYLEMSGQKIEDYRESLREDAEKSLQVELALEELSTCEKLTVSEEEFESHIGDAAAPLPEDADEEAVKAREDMMEMMRAEHSRPLIESEILREKSVGLILAIARGEDIPEPAESESEDEDQATAEATGQADDAAESDQDEEATAAEAATDEPADS